MRRADRLLQILLILRAQPVVTARQLADRLEVSERTIYRDIQELIFSGIPIEAEAGTGYCLPDSFDLPPIMFTAEELRALVLGVRTVQSWGDRDLAQAACVVLDKVNAILPERLREDFESIPLFVPAFHVSIAVKEALAILRKGTTNCQKVQFKYQRADGQKSCRTVQPLGLFYWGATWSLGSWCELRQDFRNFRLDRMMQVELLNEYFESSPGRSLQDYMNAMCD